MSDTRTWSCPRCYTRVDLLSVVCPTCLDVTRTAPAAGLAHAKARALVAEIGVWREDDSAGYHAAIDLLCRAEELLLALSRQEPTT